MGRRLHLNLDRRGLAVCICRDRPVLAPRRWLVDECDDDGADHYRCADDDNLAPGQARRLAASFRSGQPIHQRAVPAVDVRQRRHLFNEPFRQRLGQRSHGKLLLLTEDRTDRTRNQARAEVFDYIERFYNPRCKHSTLGYLSPSTSSSKLM